MKKVALVVLLILALIWLTYPKAQLTNEDPEWCFYYEFATLKHYKDTVPPADTVLIKTNGRRADIYVKCSNSPTPPLPNVPNSPYNPYITAT